MRAVPSSLTVTTERPSGLKLAATTGPEWPASTIPGRPPSACQMRAVRSRLPVTTSLPSGLNATLWT